MMCERMQFPQLVLGVMLLFITVLPMQTSAAQWVGVNMAGAEFNSAALPGRPNFDYVWPSHADLQRMANAGFTVVRVPFLWPRLQPTLFGPLDSAHLQALDAVVNSAGRLNLRVILDPHDYGTYRGAMIGSPSVPVASFADFWHQLAQHFAAAPHVVFGLMNEPHLQTAKQWAEQAQAAVHAIRATGASQLILVPGTHWSGAHAWLRSGNAEAMQHMQDPLQHMAFDLHQYFDEDASGTHANCVSADSAVQRLRGVTLWLKQQGQRGFLGEFGASRTPECLAALEQVLAYIAQHETEWLGWSYWAAGAWWGDYMFNIHSLDPVVAPQFKRLQPYLQPNTAVLPPTTSPQQRRMP